MSFNTKYYTSFTGQTTNDRFDIYLKKRDYVGDTLRLDYYSTSPLVISNQGGKDAEYNPIVGSSANFDFLAKPRYQYTASNNILLNNGFAENLGDWSQRSTGHSWFWNSGKASVNIGYNNNSVYVPAFPTGWSGSTGWTLDSTPSVNMSASSSKVLDYFSLTGFTGSGSTSNEYSITITNSSYPTPSVVDFTIYYFTATGGSINLGQVSLTVTASTQTFNGSLSFPLNKQAGRIRLGFFNYFGSVNVDINSFLGTFNYPTWGGTSKILFQTTGELLNQNYTYNYNFDFQSGTTNTFNVICRDNSNSVVYQTGITATSGNTTGSLTIPGNSINDIGFYVVGESGLTQTFNLNEVSLLTTTSYDLTPQEQFNDLLESNYKDWILQVNKNGSLYWIGYVKPENFVSKFIFPTYLIQLQAVDGLADLKNMDFPASSEKITELEAIQIALNDLNEDFDLPISSQVNIKEVHGVTGATLQHIYINPLRFTESKNGRTSYVSNYKSVEQILGKYLSNLVQSNGGWEISQRSEFNSLKRVYNNSDLSISGASINNRVIDLSSGTTLFNSDSVSKIRPYRYADIQLNNRYSGENYLSNESVTDNISGWTNTNFDVFEWSADYGGTLYVERTTGSIFTYALSESFSINTTTADTTTITYDTLKIVPSAVGNFVLTYAQLIDADTNDIIHTTTSGIITDVWSTQTFTANFSFSGNLKMRVFVYAPFYSGDIKAYFDNFKLTTQFKNNSVFDQYLLAESLDSSALETFEGNIYFGDVQTQNEVAALRYDNGTGLTTTWSNEDESNYGKSLLRWYATEILNQNRRFRNYVRFELLADQDIFYNNVLKVYDRYYNILSLSKDLLQGQFTFELSEIITGYTETISYTQGSYTTSDGSSTGGGISGGGTGSGVLNINAVNGITLLGNDLRLGGSLDANTTISTASGAKLTFDNYPVFYMDDYSANYNSRSLVDSGFVTGITSTLIGNSLFTGFTATTNSRLNYLESLTGSTGGGTITGATNGLTVTSKKIKLGGSLTGNTTILGTGYTFSVSASTINLGSSNVVLGQAGVANTVLYLKNSGGDNNNLYSIGDGIWFRNNTTQYFRLTSNSGGGIFFSATNSGIRLASSGGHISTVNNRRLITATETQDNLKVRSLNLFGTTSTPNVYSNNIVTVAISTTGATSTPTDTFSIFGQDANGAGTGSMVILSEDGIQNIIGSRTGIGTSSPSARLQVKGEGTTTGLAFRIQDSAGTDRFIIRDDGSIITNTTNNNGQLQIGAASNGGTNFLKLRNTSWYFDVVNTNGRNVFVEGSIIPFSFNTATKSVVAFHQDGLSSAGINTSYKPALWVGNSNSNSVFATGLYIDKTHNLQSAGSTGAGVKIGTTVGFDALNTLTGAKYSGIEISTNFSPNTDKKTKVEYNSILFNETINYTAAVTADTTIYGINYHPTVTNLNGAKLVGFKQAAGQTINTAKVSVSTSSATLNDYNPTGWNGASVLRIDGLTGATNLNGLAGGVDGRIVIIINASPTYFLNLSNEDAGSTASNRFALYTSSFPIYNNSAKKLIYDGTSQRWRVFE